MSIRVITRRSFVTGSSVAAGMRVMPAAQAGRTERLQITKIDLFRVVVPMQPDIISSPELGPDALTEFPGIPKFMIRLHTDSGIVGIGETSRGLTPADVQRNADWLRGKNIFDLEPAHLQLPSRGSYSGFEMAIYDALGKALGWPVYKLLGGLAQRKVLVNYWCGRKNPSDIKRVAERAVKARYTGIKVKGRPGDPIVRAVEAIASVSPALKITVDFNGHYKTVEEFLPVGKGLDAVGNMMVMEDPIVKNNLPGYRELRHQLKTPLALHLGDPRAMVAAIKSEACTMFNTGPNPSMASFVSNSELAAAANMPVWHGSGHELGVLDAAMLQSCAASANCTLPSDILSHQRVDDLILQPIDIRDSYAIVTDRPGLGVELDEEACHRYRAA